MRERRGLALLRCLACFYNNYLVQEIGYTPTIPQARYQRVGPCLRLGFLNQDCMCGAEKQLLRGIGGLQARSPGWALRCPSLFLQFIPILASLYQCPAAWSLTMQLFLVLWGCPPACWALVCDMSLLGHRFRYLWNFLSLVNDDDNMDREFPDSTDPRGLGCLPACYFGDRQLGKRHLQAAQLF